jgi:hypothetical protein
MVPTVSGVSPNNGPTTGGTAVTITGTNFASGATVIFGTVAATNVVVVSGTQITATTPPGSAGAVTVTVTVNGQSGSLPNGFTYAGTGGGGGVSTPTLVNFVSASNTLSSTLGTKGYNTCATNTYCTYLAAPSLAGNLIGVDITASGTSGAISVTDDKSNSWTCLTPVTNSTTSNLETVCYAPNATAGTFAIYVAISSGPSKVSVRSFQYAGIATSNPVDVSTSASIANNSTAVSAGSMTTTADGDLILQFACRTQKPDNGTSFTKGSGYTLQVANLLDDGCVAQTQIQATHGSITPSLTWTPSSGGTTYAVAFKKATAGTAPTG